MKNVTSYSYNVHNTKVDFVNKINKNRQTQIKINENIIIILNISHFLVFITLIIIYYFFLSTAD